MSDSTGCWADDEIRRLLTEGRLDLPAPGGGRTALRHGALFDLGRLDLSIGRLAEAHVDAAAILEAGGRSVAPAAIYGVWASDRPRAGVQVTSTATGLQLDGTKAFCTGVTICDGALVTVADLSGERPLLVDVDLRAGVADGTITVDTDRWSTPAFADTATGTVRFERHRVSSDALVGPPGWYLDRPGFWHGAVGPASVWAGGAAGLVDVALESTSESPHTMAHLGAMRALVWSMRSILTTAGDQIDADPQDRSSEGLGRALTVRHLVERQATEVLDRFGRATGPALLAFDDQVARRSAELGLYLRQDHAESDLESIERSARDGSPAL